MKPLAQKTFFSYATVAPMGRPAYLAVQNYLEEFYKFGPPDALWKYDPMTDGIAAEASKLLNCSPDEITFVNNTTEGINLAANALPLEKGDEVLVLGNEYPANLLPWLRLRKLSVDVKVIKGNDSPAAFDRLLEAINPRTRAITMSSTQYYDGYMPDLAKLSEVCRSKGIFLVVDAVQSVGVRKIDLQTTPVDFLISGGQKYLQAGPGNGFMYVNHETLGKLREPVAGIRGMRSFDEDSYQLKDSAARFQLGTQNLPGIVALHAALKTVNDEDIDNIEKKNYELLAQFKDCLTAHNIPFIDHGERQGNIISMTVDDPKGLVAYLAEHNVYIKQIKDVARLSFVHTSKLDVEKLAVLTSDWLMNHS